MKTFSAKPADVVRQWYIVDASTMPLGRLASLAARMLIGKDKPSFTPHVDGGDYVVIINAKSLVATGGKDTKKVYYRHSGFPGGLYKRTLAQQMQKDSTKVIQNAVKGMLPVNKLRSQRLARLKIYEGKEHNHHPQQPTMINLSNTKEGK